jgi:ADP-heptose:LPS heptosyltransferase
MFWMGVPRKEISRATLWAEPVTAERPYAVIHAFASRADKAWPVEKFIEVANGLKSKHGLDATFLAGPEDATEKLADQRVLAKAPLSTVKNTIAGASLFLGNDSGPAHIAAAFGIPSVVLFGPSNPVTWAPWKTEAQVLTSSGPIEQISTTAVLAATETLKVKA